MNLKVIGDRIALVIVEDENENKFFTNKKKSEKIGVVTGIGDEVTKVNVDDKILFDTHGLVSVSGENQRLHITRESNVIAIF